MQRQCQQLIYIAHHYSVKQTKRHGYKHTHRNTPPPSTRGKVINLTREDSITHAYVSDSLSDAVVPEAVVEPQSNEFERWLRSIRVLGRHVEVVHESQHLLATDRNIDALRTLLHSALDQVLDVVRRRLFQINTKHAKLFVTRITAFRRRPKSD